MPHAVLTGLFTLCFLTSSWSRSTAPCRTRVCCPSLTPRPESSATKSQTASRPKCRLVLFERHVSGWEVIKCLLILLTSDQSQSSCSVRIQGCVERCRCDSCCRIPVIRLFCSDQMKSVKGADELWGDSVSVILHPLYISVKLTAGQSWQKYFTL